MLRNLIGVLVAGTLFWTTPLFADVIYDTEYDPPDTRVTESHPYYFYLNLPTWGYGQDAYTEATFSLTYYDQCQLDIFVYAADTAGDTSQAGSYDILLGSVPYHNNIPSGTATFDLLDLSSTHFNSLFQEQGKLFLVADCCYMFDKAEIHLEAAGIPISPTAFLLGLGFVGLVTLGRSVNRKPRKKIIKSN